jgi:hypothetical protein
MEYCIIEYAMINLPNRLKYECFSYFSCDAYVTEWPMWSDFYDLHQVKMIM